MRQGTLRILVVAFVLALGACSSSPNSFVGIRANEDVDAFAVAWPKFTNENEVQLTVVSMVHFGHSDFYAEVQEILGQQDIVLMEGVTGAVEGPTQIMSHYREIAEVFGLTTQDDALKRQSNWRDSDVSASDIAEALGDSEAVIASYSRKLKRRLLLETVRSKRRFSDLQEDEHRRRAQERLRRSFAMALTNESENRDPIIIVARNKFLLSRLNDYLSSDESRSAKKIAICWGASHTPDLVERLLDSGWGLSETRWHSAFPLGREN